MKELFEQILHALERGENVVLCSILASSGSAPRGAGAKMAVFPDGTALGTIGGGAVERIAQQQALELFRTGASYCQAFCLAPNQVNDIGMICGGTVTVYFRFFDHCSPQDAALVTRDSGAFAERAGRLACQPAWSSGKITADGNLRRNARASLRRSWTSRCCARWLTSSAVYQQGRAVLLRRADQPRGKSLHLRRRTCGKGAGAGAGKCRLPRGGVRQPRGLREARKTTRQPSR